MEEVRPSGLGARDSRRLEAGLPLYGHDMTPEIDPAEADLGFAVSKRRRAEENFPGAARILGHLEDGTPRKRVGPTVDGKPPEIGRAACRESGGQEGSSSGVDGSCNNKQTLSKELR